MRASFYNIGCKVNFAELSRLKEDFATAGWDIVDFGNESDVVVINTCTVINNADSDGRKVIRRARRSSPDAYIAVTGCYAQLKPQEIAEITGVDGIFGNADKFNILKEVESFERKSEPEIHVSSIADAHFVGAFTSDSESRTRATIKIQDGCDLELFAKASS